MTYADNDDLKPMTRESTEDKLMRARCKAITIEPWYGTMASMFHWKCDPRVKTMGVRIMDGGAVECLYNPTFCDELTLEQTMAVIKHEIEHVVRLHCVRGQGGTRKPKLFNISCDMTVNGKKSKPHIEKLPLIPMHGEDGVLAPPAECVYMPEEFQENMTAEELYEKLDKEKKCPSCGGSGTTGQGKGKKPGQNQGQGQGQNQGGNQPASSQGKPCPKCNGSGHASGKDGWDGEVLDDHDIWNGSTMGEDEARQVVKDMVDQASIRAGNTPGHLVDAVRALQEPKINWKYELRQFVGRQVGNKRPTYSRMNRRRPEFGIRGQSRHASTPLLVMCDTSGSITDKMLEQFFTELESMSMRFKITLMQFDHGYQCHDRYHRGDWRKIEVKGRGGTSFIEALKHAEEKKLVGRVNIICTDGEADWPKEPKYPVLWVIFRHSNREIVPPWGSVIYLDK